MLNPRGEGRHGKCPLPKKSASDPKINIYPLIDLYPEIGENTLASHPIDDFLNRLNSSDFGFPWSEAGGKNF